MFDGWASASRKKHEPNVCAHGKNANNRMGAHVSRP